MVAVPEACASAPALGVSAGRPANLTHCHRAVAIVDTTVELLRPESDLLRLISGIGQVDVLVAVDDTPVATPGPVGVLDSGRAGVIDLTESEVDEYEDGEAFRTEIRAEIDKLGVPGLRVHRLGLRPPLGPPAEPDLVAALSELVGFDPEPGVYCLAPSSVDASRSVAGAAARRIAQVYGLPLLRYRSLELAVVPGQRRGAQA